jgi:L-fuconolactonase
MPAPPAPVTSATRPAKRSDVRPALQGGLGAAANVSPDCRAWRDHHRGCGKIAAVIDAHQHFFHPQRVAYPDVERHMPAIHRTIAPADLRPQLHAAGVDGTVLVQAANDVRETHLLLEIASQHDWVRAVVGWVPLDDPEATSAALDDVGAPALRGVRTLLHREPDPQWVVAAARLDALRVLAAHGLVFDLVTIVKGHLDNAPRLLEAVPELTVVIDHLGSPHVRSGRREPWGSLMRTAAQHPQCHVKFSGLDPVDGAVDVYRPYVDHVFEHFGADRVMWASNWPATRLGGPYQQIVDDSMRLMPALSSTEVDAVLDGNARRVYGIGSC